MNLFRKLSVSSYISILSALVGLIGFIFYFVTKGTNGYFYLASSASTIVFFVFAVLFIVLAIFLRVFDFKVEGILAKVLDLVPSVLSVLGSIFFALSAMFYISPKVEGLAFIFFSNADVIATMQTPANLLSSKLVLVTFILMLVACLVQVVSCFFTGKKEEKKA